MKKLLRTSRYSLLLLFVLFSYFIEAQEENENDTEYQTILGSDIDNGFYGALSFGYTKIGNYDAYTGGFKGAWILNHSLGLGFAGNGFISEAMPSVFNPNRDAFITGGYGGLLIEPIFFANNKVHFTIPMVIGGGGLVYIREGFDYDDEYFGEIYDSYFVFEPGIEIELNVVEFFRIAFGISYRMTSNIDLSTDINFDRHQILDKNDMNKIVAKMIFKFGKF